ncbi:MAG: RagB/SusD family nutrient uptake outer membrane protein [Gemmatimonadetes bacterium]|nr:RagB/SusD family nutrient uptake outer membrane protein [Gemmatimonadota bacterium]
MGAARRAALAAGLVVLLAACDVTNPGPVQDEFLGDGPSQQGMVNGAIRKLAEVLNGRESGVAFTGAIISRELFPGGNTNYGMSPLVQGGYIEPGSFGNLFEAGQQARFIAEESLRRFTEKKASNEMLYQARLYAGYAYRVLGENWCEAVIDGGANVPGKIYFENAEKHFTEAMTLASTPAKRLAAVAGRAQVRLWLGNYAGAAADAKEVPTTFRFDIGFDPSDINLQNVVFISNANLPYRTYSVQFTFQKDYYTQTGDPRAEWATVPGVAFANSSLQGFGQVPWLIQKKYKTPSDVTRLAGGTDMRLIEAEAALQAGDAAGALALINQVRTSYTSNTTARKLDPWTGTTVAEVGTRLKLERSIELWLEGRHFGDLRRWKDQKTPGTFTLPNYEALTPLFSTNPRGECFDIPTSERNSNPNVPDLGT